MISFYVCGDPSPKGSKTAVVRGGRAVLLDGRRGPARVKYALWKENVATYAQIAMGVVGATAGVYAPRVYAPLDGALGIEVVFYLPRPKNETKAQRSRTWHTVRPDADKLLRAVLDPLSKIVITDDARIALVRVEKRYAATPDAIGAQITVIQLQQGSFV